MNIDFTTSKHGRFAVLLNGVVVFETYNLPTSQCLRLRELIEKVHDQAFEEGKICQRALGLTAAISKSKGSMGKDQQPQSVKNQQGNPCEQGGSRNVKEGEADEQN
jgi:hypothetical protein